ncbi:hypothetical protein [Vulcanisaeta distributa]|nr:hypothetical protein [Vulcanisaeta distributa]
MNITEYQPGNPINIALGSLVVDYHYSETAEYWLRKSSMFPTVIPY